MLSEEVIQEIIAKNRKFTKGYRNDDPLEKEFKSDQELKKPQPPPCKRCSDSCRRTYCINKRLYRISDEE